MKKIILLASALALGGAAYAQDATMQPPAAPPAGDTTTAPTAAPDATTPPAAPDASTPPAAPDATAPATAPDASAPAPMGAAPAGGTPGMATGPSGQVSLTPTQGPSDVPTCSKSVTDNCKQAGGKSGGHKPMHHKK